MPWKVRFNVDECIACGTCSIACMDQCDTRIGVDALLRRAYTATTVEGGRVRIRFASSACMQCNPAPCARACPKGCYSRDAVTGFVSFDASTCIGCASCVHACPIGAVSLDATRTARKCDGCAARLAAGLRPACEEACQNGAIAFEWVPDVAEAKPEDSEVAAAAAVVSHSADYSRKAAS